MSTVYKDIIDRIKEMDKIMSRQSDKLDKINNMLNEIVEKINDISSKTNTGTTTYDGPR